MVTSRHATLRVAASSVRDRRGAECMIDQHGVPFALGQQRLRHRLVRRDRDPRAPAASAFAPSSAASTCAGATIRIACPVEIGRGEGGGLHRVLCGRQWHGDFEQGAGAGRAFQRDAALHALDDALDDRETEPRAVGLARAASACSNSRKILAWSAGAMPMPVSRTLNSTSPGQAPGSTTIATPPCSVNLIALPARLSSTCFSRVSSPITRDGRRSSI